MQRVAVAVTGVAAVGLVLATTAAGHLSVTPGVIELGRTATLLVELPRLRPGTPPRTLEVTGDGLRTLSVAREPGGAPESRWRVRVRAEGTPGTVPLNLRAGFPDGSTVQVHARLTVVPAEEDGRISAAALAGAVAAALAAVAATLLLLHRGRRR